MVIGQRLKTLRESKNLSQGDIEKRTGLLRCYISRVENGHTVPAIETLEKMARAMEVELYQLFTADAEPKPNGGRSRDTKNTVSAIGKGREDSGEGVTALSVVLSLHLPKMAVGQWPKSSEVRGSEAIGS